MLFFFIILGIRNPSFPTKFECLGVDFTKFAADGSNLDGYVSYTYDATWAIAKAMHVVLYNNKESKITGKSKIILTLIFEVNFNHFFHLFHL